MPRVIITLLVLALFVPALSALDEKSPAEQFQAIKKEYETTLADLNKASREAKTAEEKQKVREQAGGLGKFAGKMLELAEKHPKDPVAVDALIWVTRNARVQGERQKALSTLKSDHVEGPRAGAVVEALARVRDPETEKIARTVLEKNSNKEARGLAAITLAGFYLQRADREKDIAEKLLKDANALLDETVAKYGDVPHLDGTVAETVHTFRNSDVGKVAADIKGEDTDGKKFKLSDYRGKVVMLDFWGHW